MKNLIRNLLIAVFCFLMGMTAFSLFQPKPRLEIIKCEAGLKEQQPLEMELKMAAAGLEGTLAARKENRAGKK